jgi:tetratricopeptide (TPR) repeat protein
VELAQKGQEPSERYRIGMLGWAYYRAGKFEDCIRRLREVEDLYHPSNHLVLAMAHHRLGHSDEARKRLAQVEESYTQATRDSLKAPTFSSLLWTWRWPECADFVVLLREAKTLIKGTAPKEDDNLAALQAKARRFLKGLDTKTEAYDRALAMQQDQPRLWLARGRRHAELKRWKEADADLARAIALRPHDPQVWTEAGRICAEHGRPDRAAEWFGRSLRVLQRDAESVPKVPLPKSK